MLGDPVVGGGARSTARGGRRTTPRSPASWATYRSSSRRRQRLAAASGRAAERILSQGVYGLTAVGTSRGRRANRVRRGRGSRASPRLAPGVRRRGRSPIPTRPSGGWNAPSRAASASRAPASGSGRTAGSPCRLSGFSGPTPTGIRIGPVYTPPEHRRRGYATTLVADQSAWLLEQGHRACFLYTDLANPTSNRIYVEIGYERGLRRDGVRLPNGLKLTSWTASSGRPGSRGRRSRPARPSRRLRGAPPNRTGTAPAAPSRYRACPSSGRQTKN